MKHYFCQGECNTSQDTSGICQDEKCTQKTKELKVCECEDNKHEKEEMANSQPIISYDEFIKVHLKVVQVLEAERVEGSEKLLKLKVALGDTERQIVAGIGKVYVPEDIIGKNIIIVANLAPRKLMGLESQGMVLAASNEEGPILLIPDKDVASGCAIS